MVSQAASSVKLSGSSPYFFRVNPADDQQGKTLASVAVQQLHAKTVLIMQDTTDPYSSSLANAFSNSLKAAHRTVINAPDNFTSRTTTVTQYEQTTIPYILARQPDLIFLAGYDIDGIRLAHALGESARAHPTSSFLANLKILGGDALDSDLLLGLGNGPEATIAAAFPQDMQRLIFSAFAHPDEWNFFRVPQKQQPVLFADWTRLYRNTTVPRTPVIMAYDALQIIMQATRLVSAPLTGQTLRDALASLGHGNVPAFQGVSGRISFDSQGNPINKALVVLDVEQKNGQNMIVLHQIAGKFF